MYENFVSFCVVFCLHNDLVSVIFLISTDYNLLDYFENFLYFSFSHFCCFFSILCTQLFALIPQWIRLNFNHYFGLCLFFMFSRLSFSPSVRQFSSYQVYFVFFGFIHLHSLFSIMFTFGLNAKALNLRMLPLSFSLSLGRLRRAQETVRQFSLQKHWISSGNSN